MVVVAGGGSPRDVQPFSSCHLHHGVHHVGSLLTGQQLDHRPVSVAEVLQECLDFCGVVVSARWCLGWLGSVFGESQQRVNVLLGDTEASRQAFVGQPFVSSHQDPSLPSA